MPMEEQNSIREGEEGLCNDEKSIGADRAVVNKVEVEGLLEAHVENWSIQFLLQVFLFYENFYEKWKIKRKFKVSRNYVNIIYFIFNADSVSI